MRYNTHLNGNGRDDHLHRGAAAARQLELSEQHARARQLVGNLAVGGAAI